MKRTFIKEGIFTIFATLIFALSSLAQTKITTGALSPTSVCIGKSVSVPFATEGVVVVSTNFVAQLSNASGSFASPVNVGNATTSPITAVIPVGTLAGTGYKIRVIAELASIPVPLVTFVESSALIVKAVPAAPTLPHPLSFCLGQPGIVPPIAGSNIKWYSTGGPEVPAVTTVSTAATRSPAAIYAYISQTVDGCESALNPMTYGVYLPETMPTVTNKNYIVGDTPVSLITSVTSGTNLLWYFNATGGAGTGTPPTVSTAMVGTTSYWVSQAGNCESPRAKIDVIVAAAPCTTPAPVVVTPLNYAVGQTNIPPLTAVGTGSLIWFTQETGGVGVSTAPIPSTSTAGTTSYWVTQTVDGCESTRARLDVVVCTPSPAPTIVQPAAICQNNTSINTTTILSQAITSTGSNYKWYASANATSFTTTIPSTSVITPGSFDYYVTQTNSGQCESPKAKITIIVTPAPSPPGVINRNYTVGQTNIPALTATGTGTFFWFMQEVSGASLPAAPVPSTATAGTTSYWVTQTIGNCESPRAKIDVIVTCATSVPTVTSPVNYNVGVSSSPLTAGPAGATLKWYTVESGGVALGGAPTPGTTASDIGTKTWWVGQIVNGCEGPRAKIDVIVTCATVAPTVTSPVNYNVGVSASPLTAGPAGATFKWYTVESGGVALGVAPTPGTTASDIGTKTWWVSQIVNGCEGPRAKIDVIVTCATVAPTVTSTINYNVGAVATALSATGATGAIFKWYNVEIAGAALGGAPTPGTATSDIGTRSWWVSQTVNGCEGPRAKIDVIVTACPTVAPTVTSPVNYNVGASATPLTATGTTGAIFKWYTQQNGGTALGGAPTPGTTASDIGTKSWWVSQIVNGCEGPRAKIDVIVTCPTVAPTVTSPINYSVGATASPLTATGSPGAIFKWYTQETGGTALGGAPIPGTAASDIGTKSWWVSQTVNGCEGPRAKIDVIVNCGTPAPTVSTPINYCVGAIAIPLTASGVLLKWYNVSEGGTALDAAPTPGTTAADIGTKSYWVSQTVNGCEGLRAKIDVTVTQTAAPTLAGVEYCKDVPASALTAPGATNPKWYTSSTGGTGVSTGPVPSTGTVGTTTPYYVSQTIGACESPRSPQSVTIKEAPGQPGVSNVSYCRNSPASTLTANGNSLKWYTVQNGGNALGAAPTPSTSTDGTVPFYVSQTGANGCESARAILNVTINPLPNAPGVTPTIIEYCQFFQAPALSAVPNAPSTLLWYGTAATGGTPSPNAPIPDTQDPKNSVPTSYYVAQRTQEGCIGDRAKIDVKINFSPKPVTNTYLPFCQSAPASPLSATGTNVKWYRNATTPDSQTNPLIPFTDKVEDYSFYVTQTGSNGCESPKEEIKIHIKGLPSATISGSASIGLGESANIRLTFTSDGPWKYILSSGISGNSNNAVIDIPVTPLTTTTYLVTEVSNECGKGIPIGSALITVRVPTITTGNPSLAEVCAGKSFQVPFQQSGTFPTGYTFKVQMSTVNENTQFKNIPSVVSSNMVTVNLPDTIKGGNYFVRVISSGSAAESIVVPGSIASVNISVNPLPSGAISGSKTILFGENADLKIDFLGKAPWTFNLNNGTKDSSITATITPYTFLLKPKVTTTYTINSIVNVCGTVAKGTGSARIQVDPILGIEPPVVTFVKVYPTIVDNKCIVELDEPISAKQSVIELIDLSGRTMTAKKIKQKITEVDLSNYAGGLYLIRILNGNHTSVHRVMKR